MDINSSPESMPPGRGRASLSRDQIHAKIGAMLLREGIVDSQSLSKCNRLLVKMGEEQTLFSVLAKMGLLTEEKLLDTVRKQQPDLPLGSLLVQLSIVSQTQLRQALRLQEQGNFEQKIGELLISRRMIKERDLTRVLASQLGFKSEEPEIGDCDVALLSRVTLKVSRSMGFIPIRLQGDSAVVAFVDPMDQEARTEAARALEVCIVH